MSNYAEGFEDGYAEGLEAGRLAGYEDGLAEAPSGGGAATWGAFGIVSGAFLVYSGFGIGSALLVGVLFLLSFLASIFAALHKLGALSAEPQVLPHGGSVHGEGQEDLH